MILTFSNWKKLKEVLTLAFKGAVTFILLGLTLAAIGGWWMLLDQGLVQEVESKYWIDNDYLDIMRMEWHGLSLILFVVGVVLAIIGAAGTGSREAVE